MKTLFNLKSVMIIVLSLCINVCFAQTNNQTFTPEQQEQIKNIIHQYLITNPEVLIEASNVLKRKEITKSNQIAEKAARKNANELLRDPNVPVVGNPKGKVSLVMFFDYQCIHCRQMPSTIQNLIKENPELRIVYRDFPIFGPHSVFAAKAGLAANRQGKYAAFHFALMSSRYPLTQQHVLDIAKKVGLDINKLQKDMKDPIFAKLLKANYKLANAMELIGTPEFVVTRTDLTPASNAILIPIPGAVPQQQLQSAIDKVK